MTDLINNLPTDHKRFVVAQIIDGDYWFWGSWDNKDDAQRAISEMPDGVIYLYDSEE